MQKNIKSVVSLALVVALSLPTSIASLANSSNPTVDAGGIASGPAYPGSGSGGAHLLWLTTIDNEIKNVDGWKNKEEFKNSAGETIGGPSANIIHQYRNKVDETIFTADQALGAAYLTKEGYKTSNNNAVYIIMGGQAIYKYKPGMYPNEDALGKVPDPKDMGNNYWQWYKASVQNPQSDHGTGTVLDFNVKTKEMAELFVQAAIDGSTGLGSETRLIANQIKVGFNNDLPGVANLINTYSIVTDPNATGETRPMLTAAYQFQMLAAIYRLQLDYSETPELCDSSREALINYYLTQNNDSTEKHTVTACVALSGQRGPASNPDSSGIPRMYSMTDALNDAGVHQMGSLPLYNAGFVSTFFEPYKSVYGSDRRTLEEASNAVMHNNSGYLGFKQSDVWMYHYFTNHRIIPNGFLEYNGNSKKFWTNSYSWDMAIMQTDANGNPWGPRGYTLFAGHAAIGGLVDNGHSPYTPDPNKPENSWYPYEFSLTATPDNKDLSDRAEDCVENELADITIKLQADSDQIGKTWAWFEQQSGSNKSFKLTLFLEGETIKGSDPMNTEKFDTLTTGSGFWTLTTVNGKKAIQSLDIKTKAELQDYVNGSKSTILLHDQQVTVCENLKNRYYTYGVLCFHDNGNHKDDLPGKPTGPNVEDGKSYDDASWIKDRFPHYYSDMRQIPLAEIKHNKPYAEDAKDPTGNGGWEAMAGIPTTANVFTGTGATEYMINVELRWRTEGAKRTYTFEVTNTGCTGTNQACTGTCPGEQKDSEGNITHDQHSPLPCGAYETHATHHRNSHHTGGCKYTYEIEVEVDPYAYMDITGLDIWTLDNFKYEGNNKLTNPSSFNLPLNIGVDAFYSVEGYSSGNGRLLFSTTLQNAQDLWGNTKFTQTGTDNAGLHTACKDLAVNIINIQVGNLTAETVTVVSDYAIMETTEGYQSAMYYTYTSKPLNLSGCKVTASDFGDFADDTSTTNLSYKYPNPLKFEFYKTPEELPVETLWNNNSLSSAKWDADHPTTSGYNGNYGSVKTKYSQSNDTESHNPAQTLITKGQPNLKEVSGPGSYSYSTSSSYNKYYVKTGLNILDSTTPPPDRAWSTSDSIKPVTNGEWNTGNMKVKYKQAVHYKGTDGDDWSKWTVYKEAPYSDSHDKINNILIHNPISNSKATVISVDKKYDQRVYEDLLPGQISAEMRKCPRNSNCMFSHLHCNTASYHNNSSCYRDLPSGYDCGFIPNTHICNDSCKTLAWKKATITNIFHNTISYGKDSTGTDVITFTATDNGYVIAYSNTCTVDPRVRIYVNGTKVAEDDDSGRNDQSNLNFNSGWVPVNAGDSVRVNVYHHGTTSAGSCETVVATSYGGEPGEMTDREYFKVENGAILTLKDGSTVALNTTYSNGYTIYKDIWDQGGYKLIRHASGCTYNGENHLWNTITNSCLGCTHSTHNNDVNVASFDQIDWTKFVGGCSGVLNAHSHTSSCKLLYSRYLVCTDPHHYTAGDPHDIKDQKNHYPFADTRCYTPCNDDSNHSTSSEITLPDGQKQSSTGIFIMLDREFQIYYPDLGDFQQDPNLWGLGQLSKQLGPGYKNNMDTDQWLRNKYVSFPSNTMDAAGNVWGSGEKIDLLKLPNTNKVYTFTNLLANGEANSATVQFLSVANNAPESIYYNDARRDTNNVRAGNYAAEMSVIKTQVIDIVGSIGALRIEDVGDPRFATLFKQSAKNNKWLIPNVVPEVDYSLPNKIVADNIDARQDPARATQYYHGIYGTTTLPTGGIAHDYYSLPLVPRYNPIKSLQEEPMRPGYKLMMSIETIGDYYGENYQLKDDDPIRYNYNRTNSNGNGAFSYKMQILPRYYELNLDTKQYKEVDIYMYENSTYVPIYKGVEDMDKCSEYHVYLNWLEEAQRRSFTTKESQVSVNYQTVASEPPKYMFRLPTNEIDVIGTPNMMILIDIDRTLIGSSTRYGKSYVGGNKELGISQNRIHEHFYNRSSQRWHWTLGLPSSSVFVYADQPCNDTNIKEMQSHNAVIVCALDLKVRGNVWTLKYDGSNINNDGFQIIPDGPTYPTPPTGPNTPTAPKDPVVVVYTNDKTSKDDMTTTGTH